MSANGKCQHCGRADVMVRTRAGFGGNPRRPLVPVDACIAQLVDGLNRGGVTTLGACCGHGKGPASILLADGREIAVHPTWTSTQQGLDRRPVRIVASSAEPHDTVRLRRLEQWLRLRARLPVVAAGVLVGIAISLTIHAAGVW